MATDETSFALAVSEHRDPRTDGEERQMAPGVAAAANAEPPKLIRVPVDSLNPHPDNSKIFRESLEDAALESMARDLAANGQHEPIIVNPKNTILEGHRRCRALQLAGISHAQVIVDYTPRSVEEEMDYILDSYTHKRKASLTERVNLFEELVESYSRRHGRPRGRPKKVDRNLSNYWDASRIRVEAARAAGFGSRETARQASVVMRSSDEDLKKRLANDELSIDAAHDILSAKGSQSKLETSAASRGSNEQAQPSEGVTPQEPARPALTRSGTGGPKGRRQARSEARPAERSPGALPVPAHPAESPGLAGDGVAADDSEAGARVTNDQAASARHSLAAADELDIDAALDAAEMDDLVFALVRKIEGAADSGSPEFGQCVDRFVSMITEAAAKAITLKPVAKTGKRARKVA